MPDTAHRNAPRRDDRKLADRMRAQTAALQDAARQVAHLTGGLVSTLTASAASAELLDRRILRLTWAVVVLSVVMAAAAALAIADWFRAAPGGG